MKGLVLALVAAAAGLAALRGAGAGECGVHTIEKQSPKCLGAVTLSNTVRSSGIKPEVAITIPKRCNLVDRPVGYKCGGGVDWRQKGAVMLSNTVRSSGIKPEVAITIPKRCNLVDRPVGYKCGGGVDWRQKGAVMLSNTVRSSGIKPEVTDEDSTLHFPLFSPPGRHNASAITIIAVVAVVVGGVGIIVAGAALWKRCLRPWLLQVEDSS